MKTGKIHQAWLVFIACALLLAGGIGLLSKTSSVFITSVCSDKQLSFVQEKWDETYQGQYDKLIADGKDAATAEAEATKYADGNYVAAATVPFSMYMLVQGILTGIFLFFVNKMYVKFGLKKVVIFGVILTAVTYIAMSFFNELWQFYLAGVILAFSSSLVWFLPAPILINTWFAKKNGIALGVATACSPVMGAIMSPVITMLIDAFKDVAFFNGQGWRGAYFTIAIISLVLSLPCTFLFIKSSPQEVGLKPYGADDVNVADQKAKAAAAMAGMKSIDTKTAMRSLSFVLIVLMASFAAYITTHTNVMTNFGTEGLGFDLKKASFIISAILIGEVIFKIVLGALNDKIGSLKTIYAGCAIGVLGFALLILAEKNSDSLSILSFVGGFFIGAMSGVSGATIPAFVRDSFGPANYGAIYGIVGAILALLGSLAVLIVPSLAKSLGYSPAFIVAAAACVLIALFAIIATSRCKKMMAAIPDEVAEEAKEA